MGAEAFTGTGFQAHLAIQGADGVGYHVEPHAAPGQLGNRFLEAEAWQQQEFQQFGRAQLGGDLGWTQPPGDDRGANALQVQAATIVVQADLQAAGDMAGLETDLTAVGLAQGAAFGR